MVIPVHFVSPMHTAQPISHVLCSASPLAHHLVPLICAHGPQLNSHAAYHVLHIKMTVTRWAALNGKITSSDASNTDLDGDMNMAHVSIMQKPPMSSSPWTVLLITIVSLIKQMQIRLPPVKQQHKLSSANQVSMANVSTLVFFYSHTNHFSITPIDQDCLCSSCHWICHAPPSHTSVLQPCTKAEHSMGGWGWEYGPWGADSWWVYIYLMVDGDLLMIYAHIDDSTSALNVMHHLMTAAVQVWHSHIKETIIIITHDLMSINKNDSRVSCRFVEG